MMKVFTVEDFLRATPENQKKVSDWLDKYGLVDVNLVTSQSILNKGSEDIGFGKSEVTVFEEDHVAVYADITVKRFITETEFIPISNSDTSPNAYTKIAEFFFDDFPWEIKEV
jgi:hypothetical protein